MANLHDRSHEQLMRKQLLLLAIVFVSFVCVLFQIDTSVQGFLLPSGRILDREFEGQAAYLVNTAGCKIQNMDPFDDIIRPFIKDIKPPQCNMYEHGRLVKANLDSIYMDFDVLQRISANMSVDPSQIKCYYKEFWRQEEAFLKNGLYPSSVDTHVRYSSERNEIKNQTFIKKEEFIKVFCELNSEHIYVDYFAFPQIKSGKRKENDTVSVLMLGIDAVSRLNLHRQMPRTVAFLKEKVNSIEMLGYNKVGDNTFPNLMPMLAGLSEEELKKTCWAKENVFDDCPFIWEKFKNANFTTAYYEDAAWMGLFNYQKHGFRKQPTDFYGQIYTLEAERDIGKDKRLNAHLCIGNRMTLDVLLDNAWRYINKVKASGVLSWAIFWSSSLTHDFLNLPRFGDVPYTNFLENLFNEDIFNSHIVFVMSDHGIRWGEIRSTYQGYVEERLPFLFVSFPEWFSNVYKLATRNLRTNRRRLTTHFDLHETLQDLVDLRNIRDDMIKIRARKIKNKRGISLFLPIPESRTCRSAGISENWCTCHKSTPISTSSPMVKRTAETIVDHINLMLKDYSMCSHLRLNRTLSARIEELKPINKDEHQNTLSTKFTDYIVSVVTTPGNGVFEATVRYSSATNNLAVVNTVSRLNTYGDQSKCISHYFLKLYCFCI